MERRDDEESQTGDRKGTGESFSIVDSIKKICAKNARAELDNEVQLTLFLQSWWSRTYNRPLKDPLLLDYTLEELLYEFFDRTERIKATEEQLNIENDRIEANKEQEVLDWAEAEEKKELEAMKAAAAAQQDPTKDPENVAWMEEQMKQAKKMFGEDFGDDVDESFE